MSMGALTQQQSLFYSSQYASQNYQLELGSFSVSMAIIKCKKSIVIYYTLIIINPKYQQPAQQPYDAPPIIITQLKQSKKLIQTITQNTNQSRSTMQAQRDKFLLKLRREQVEKILHKERDNMHKKYQLQQQQQFGIIYPNITLDNYHQHKFVLSHLVVSPKFVYQIVQLSGIVYQYLIEHPDDFDSILILKYVSAYEEVRIPQTRELVQILLSLMQGKGRFDALLICANLLQSGRYQLLRDHLIQSGFVNKANIFSQQSQLYGGDDEKNKLTSIMTTEILCNMISTHPLINLKEVEAILRLIKKTLKYEEQKWALFDSMLIIRQKQKHNKKYSKLLLEQLEPVLLQERFGSQIPILNLLIYAAYSGVYCKNQKIIGLISHVIKNHGTNVTNSLDLALDCAGLYLDQGIIELEGQILWNLLLTSKGINRKQSILKVLESLNQQSLIDSFLQSSQNQQIIWQLMEQLQNKQTEYLATTVFLKLAIQEQIRLQLVSLGLVKKVEGIYEQYHMEDCEHLEQLLDILANNNQAD